MNAINKRAVFISDNSILIELMGYNKKSGSVNFDCVPQRAEVFLINKDTVKISLFTVSESGDYFLQSYANGLLKNTPLSLSKIINDYLRDGENFLILINN